MSIYSESRQLQSALDALNREQSANCRLVAQLEAAQAQLEDIETLLIARGKRRNAEQGETVAEMFRNFLTDIDLREALRALDADPTDYQGAD
jgi:hypothetical protein